MNKITVKVFTPADKVNIMEFKTEDKKNLRGFVIIAKGAGFTVECTEEVAPRTIKFKGIE